MTTRAGAVAMLVLGLAATGAMAQETVDAVAEHDNWSVFEADNPRQCFIASKAAETQIMQNGKPAKANREEPVLNVVVTPGPPASTIVSVDLGFPPDRAKDITLKIGDVSYNLLPGVEAEREWAWTRPEHDTAAIDAMRSGSVASVVSESLTKKTFTDSFSLVGFTAALGDAAARCAPQ